MMRGNVLLEFFDHFVEIRIQHRNLYLDLSFRRLFGDRDLDMHRDKEKRMNSQKILYSCHEEVYSKFLIHFSLSGSISVSGQLPTYPSPNPTLTLTCCQLTVVELGEG